MFYHRQELYVTQRLGSVNLYIHLVFGDEYAYIGGDDDEDDDNDDDDDDVG